MTNEEKYLNALRDIENHIRSKTNAMYFIVKTLQEILPEYEVKNEDIEDWL